MKHSRRREVGVLRVQWSVSGYGTRTGDAPKEFLRPEALEFDRDGAREGNVAAYCGKAPPGAHLWNSDPSARGSVGSVSVSERAEGRGPARILDPMVRSACEFCGATKKQVSRGLRLLEVSSRRRESEIGNVRRSARYTMFSFPSAKEFERVVD